MDTIRTKLVTRQQQAVRALLVRTAHAKPSSLRDKQLNLLLRLLAPSGRAQ